MLSVFEMNTSSFSLFFPSGEAEQRILTIQLTKKSTSESLSGIDIHNFVLNNSFT